MSKRGDLVKRTVIGPPSAPRPGETITVHLSIPVTRRKQFHYVMGEREFPLMITMNSAAVFDWLYENDVKEFFVDAEKNMYRVAVLPSTS